MSKKKEIFTFKAWLWVLASLIDEMVILALIFLGLWLFHVEITWWLVVIVVAVMAVYALIMHRAIVPLIRRRIIHGAEGMVGMTGIATESCKPAGTVKICGEFWKAKAVRGAINKGEDVEVVGINGLCLEVRKKKP
jgi:membrane protein implicated in regulation of membrane protease activity